MTTDVTRPAEPALELARMLATLAWVVAGSALVLGGLDALPALLGAAPRTVRAVASVAEAERIVGARLAEPGYFPERLAWPPATIRVSGGRGGSVAMIIDARDGSPAVELLQAAPGGTIAREILGDVTELHTSATTVQKRPARVADVLVNGERWTSLSWQIRDRPIVLRSRGPVEELYRMARSMRVEGGR